MKRVVDFSGSVSEATMRTQDLVPSFLDVLSQYDPETCARIEADMVKTFGSSDLDDDDDAWDTEDMAYILNEDLWEALNELAPEGFYFGSHPGDGCDYGYWLSEDLAYILYQYNERKTHNEDPEGSYDNAGRWYPSDNERCPCCDAIREPSRSSRYTLLDHCASLGHCAMLHDEDPDYVRRVYQIAKKLNALPY